MLLVLLVSLLTSPLVDAVADTPKFVLQPRNTEAVRGETVTLYCSVGGQLQGGQFVWVKDGSVVTRGFTVLTADPQRFSIGTAEAGAYHLIITDSRPEDSGSYRCLLTTGGTGLISDTATLQIWSAPTAEYPTCTGAGSGEVAVGERLTLTCDVEGGNPKAQLFLNKGDVAVETQETETGITYDWTVTEADEATEFLCIGTQRFWAEPRTCRLGPFHLVRGQPTVSLVPAETTVQGGQSVSFLCSADSAPRASYRWFVGGDEVDRDDAAARMAVQEIGGSSILLMHDVGNEDETLEILCVVEAATGTVSALAVMHVQPVYAVITEVPPTKAAEGSEDSADTDTDPAGSDDASSQRAPTDEDDEIVGEPEIFESTNLPLIVGCAAAGVAVVLMVVIVIAIVHGRKSGNAATRSTEKLAEGAPADNDNYYFRSRFVSVARSWLFPVHQDTQKGMTASMASQPVRS